MMKKFLSSLLALTMILSLVIVPANAAADITGTATVKRGETTTLTVFDKPAKVEVSGTEYTVTDTAPTYRWTSGTPANATVPANSTNRTVDVTGVAAGTSVITCTMTVQYSVPAANGAGADVKLTSISKDVTVTVTDPDGEANAAFQNAITDITYNGRKCEINKSKTNVTYYKYEGDLTDTWGAQAGSAYEDIMATASDNKLTVSGKLREGNKPVTAVFTPTKGTISLTINSSITGKPATDSEKVIVGGDLDLTAVTKGVDSPYHEWKLGSADQNNKGATFTFNTKEVAAPQTVTCNIYDKSTDGKTLIATASCKVEVVKDEWALEVSPSSAKLTEKGQKETFTAKLMSKFGSAADAKITFTTADNSIITLKDNKDGTADVTLKSSGKATVMVTASYLGKSDYKETIKITGSMLSGSLKSVTNGDTLEFDYRDLEKLADKAIDDTSVTINSIQITDAPKTDAAGGAIYTSSSSNKPIESYRLDSGDELEFRAADGYVGDYSMTIKVKDTKGTEYTIAVTIPVTSAGNIKETVTGSSSSSSVSFDVNSVVKYDKLYVYGSKSSSSFTPSKLSNADTTGYNGYWDGSTRAKDGWVLYDDDDTITIPANKFNSGKVTLYVVGLDDDGVASTGTIEVSQKSYGIEYNVVAGETLSFDQKAFESFMNDYADDNIDTNRGDYFELQYVKFDSLPNSTREGVLYEGKDKIKTSTEVENLDKVTFESVAKAKDTIKVPFTLYAKQYDKNDKVIDKKVSMTGEVVISVVKEDIVFEVGVNSAIKLGSDKFIDFLRDSDKSYKKADLDYVTFDVGKNSAITSYFNGTGALYRYYNGSTGINATVSAKDEFYYNPKTSSKHYDLDDVTYVTSKFAKVGDIVYIPFTAYGTKSGQKAEGTLAIKVKQTMNFVDVHTYDYFYDSVQWAVNLDITKGTSATTFSPKQGCTRAQIVTFLWRAANSPAPRSSTNKFTDVYATTHADYMKAIIWATEQGITTGTGNGKFSPDATCTRAQIVTFLYRFKNNPAVYGSLNFSDVNKTEHAAFYNAILWAVNNKITTGYGNGIFDPNGTCNRGDAVTFLYRALA